MWQKLNRLDTVELEKARIQIINAVQLVSAAPRCYIKSKKDNHRDWLTWDPEASAIESLEFGTKEKVIVSLDFEQFVLSIQGAKNHIEHLVLSGITYPMAFGWMKIKLDSFGLDGDVFTDNVAYSIERPIGPDEELHVSNQQVFSSLAIYYSNACNVLKLLAATLDINGDLFLLPANLNLLLKVEKNNNGLSFGFSPGDKSYPEPYFFIKFAETSDHILSQLSNTIGIWNTKDWNGFVFLASDFLTLEPEDEQNKVVDFFKNNLQILQDQ